MDLMLVLRHICVYDCVYVWLLCVFVYPMHKAFIFPVLRHSGQINGNICSVAEQRQQLSVEHAAAWGVTLLECSHV